MFCMRAQGTERQRLACTFKHLVAACALATAFGYCATISRALLTQTGCIMYLQGPVFERFQRHHPGGPVKTDHSSELVRVACCSNGIVRSDFRSLASPTLGV
eukprot:1851397-Pleurochrysis_carterae.AAC.2